jgi:hypothetical protein
MRRGAGGLIATVAVAATIGVISVSASLAGSSGSGDTLTVQVKADLTQVAAALASRGFQDTRSASSMTSSYATNCAANATLEVKQFLTQNQCKEYATAILIVRKRGTTTRVAITWVVMPSVTLAKQYKAIADAYGKGNPPGQPPTFFPGRCYASGQNGATVWAEQVQPTGNLTTDQEILQAAAPTMLSRDDLREHCVR